MAKGDVGSILGLFALLLVVLGGLLFGFFSTGSSSVLSFVKSPLGFGTVVAGLFGSLLLTWDLSRSSRDSREETIADTRRAMMQAHLTTGGGYNRPLSIEEYHGAAAREVDSQGMFMTLFIGVISLVVCGILFWVAANISHYLMLYLT